MNLSAYVRKLGTTAHARAGFSDVWRGELTGTGQAVRSVLPDHTREVLTAPNQIAIKVLHLATEKFVADGSDRTNKVRIPKLPGIFERLSNRPLGPS